MEKKRIIPKGLWFILIPTILGVLYYFVVIDIWLKKPITGIYHHIISVDSLRNEIRFFHDYYRFEFAGIRLGQTQKVSVFSVDSLRVLSSKENISGVPIKSKIPSPTFTLQGSPEFLSTDFAIAVGKTTTKQRFIKPMIIYQDAYNALVLHQTTHFDESDRMLSFISDSASVIWTAPQAILFPELELTPSNPTSKHPTIAKQLQTFATRNTIVLSYNSIGFLLFDKNTGQQRFYYHK